MRKMRFIALFPISPFSFSSELGNNKQTLVSGRKHLHQNENLDVLKLCTYFINFQYKFTTKADPGGRNVLPFCTVNIDKDKPLLSTNTKSYSIENQTL